jgi:hypothetical protein
MTTIGERREHPAPRKAVVSGASGAVSSADCSDARGRGEAGTRPKAPSRSWRRGGRGADNPRRRGRRLPRAATGVSRSSPAEHRVLRAQGKGVEAVAQRSRVESQAGARRGLHRFSRGGASAIGGRRAAVPQAGAPRRARSRAEGRRGDPGDSSGQACATAWACADGGRAVPAPETGCRSVAF